MKLRSAALVALAMLVLVGGQASGAARGPGTKFAPCGPPQGALQVIRFLRAFNAGDTSALDRLVARPDWFKSYFVGGQPGARTDLNGMDRTTLLPYFAERHAAGEQLALVSAHFGAKRDHNGFLGFYFTLVRTANDLSQPVLYDGKGALACLAKGIPIGLWVMGPKSHGTTPR